MFHPFHLQVKKGSMDKKIVIEKIVCLTGSTKYPEHLGFTKIGALMGAAFAWGVVTDTGGERNAASFGSDISCAARSAGLMRWVVGVLTGASGASGECSVTALPSALKYDPVLFSGGGLASLVDEMTASDNRRPSSCEAWMEMSSAVVPVRSMLISGELSVGSVVFESASPSSSISRADIDDGSSRVCDMLRREWSGWPYGIAEVLLGVGTCEVDGDGRSGIGDEMPLPGSSWMADIDSDSPRPLKDLRGTLRVTSPPKEPFCDRDGCPANEGRRDSAGVVAVGVAGPSCPWSNICSLVANSCLHTQLIPIKKYQAWKPTHLHILHLIRRRGPPGVFGRESEGVRGYFANISVWGGDPSPSDIKNFWWVNVTSDKSLR